MKKLFVCLNIIASSAAMATTTIDPVKDNGWQPMRGSTNLGSPLATEKECWDKNSLDAETRKTTANYECRNRKLARIVYTAAPVTPPSGLFTVGQTVAIIGTTTANIRETPAGNLLGTHAIGDKGIVKNNSVVANFNGVPVTWWSIDFNTGVDGWVGEDRLQASSVVTDCSTVTKPAVESRTVTCPAGTTGSWTQSRDYMSAPVPTCWNAGEWSPVAAPTGTCVTVINPPPATTTAVPMSWNDPVFVNVVNSGALNLSSGQSRSNLSISEQSGQPSIICQGSCMLDKIRINSREGYRCVSGNQTLTNVWIEAVGTSDDHADGIQCYSPGSSGVLTVKNTTIKVSGVMNAAYFSADNWNGSHVLENVLLWGGNYSFFVPGDGGTSVSLKNVFIVKDAYRYGPIRMDVVNGKRPTILQWDNVRYVTIQNDQMVMGELIPKPY